MAINSKNGTNGNSIARNNINATHGIDYYKRLSDYAAKTTGRAAIQKNTGRSTYDANRGSVTYGGLSGSSNTDTDKPSGGGSSGGSGGSGSSSGGELGYTAGANYAGMYGGYMDALNKYAQAAYNNSMKIVDDYYNTAAENLRKNYDESVGTLDRNNDLNTRSINADAEAAMRQAYINNMLSRKSLQQAMTAQGLNGGATETTRASLENNYGNARNNIDTTRNKNLADLMTQYQNNLASLRQQLNTGLSDLDTNRLNYSIQINDDLQSMLDSQADRLASYLMNANPEDNNTTAAAMTNLQMIKRLEGYPGNNGDLGVGLNGVATPYLNNLQNLASDSAYFGMNPAEAQNYYDPVSMQQAALSAGSTNYQKALAAQEALGATTPSARNTALSRYGNISSLQEILRQLGYGGY